MPSHTPSVSEYLASLAELSRMSQCTNDSHAEAKKDDARWLVMECVGIQETGLEYDLELRNCHCGSTLCRRIPKSAKSA
jgi:hypothetical protein